MSYIENPKTRGSGILCAIPQRGTCPTECADCFFQAGRSYLEPLDENLPNVPNPETARGRIVRLNDGNDSNNQRELVNKTASLYEDVFFNTASPGCLESYPGPVVLTVNPAELTNADAWFLDVVPANLMFVRVRANLWNVLLLDRVVEHYCRRAVPVVITFMAYYKEAVPASHSEYYTYRKRTLNSYWVITQQGWDKVMERYKYHEYVYPCGKSADSFPCRRCGNCLREYFATKERMRVQP